MKKFDDNDDHKELDLDVIKRILIKDPSKRNTKNILILSNQIRNINFFQKYQEEGYEDGTFFHLLSLIHWFRQQLVHVQCARYLKYEFIKKGEAVFHIDTVGDKFYLTIQGKVGIYIRLPFLNKKKDNLLSDDPKSNLTCVKELESGFGFGELALLNNKPRMASIYCHQDSHFMTLDKSSFLLILKQKEEEKLLKEMTFFAKLPFFEGWNFNLIKLLYLNSFRIKYIKNEKIFSEGDDPNKVFIITSGEFLLFKEFDYDKEDDEFGFKETKLTHDLKKEDQKQKKQIQLSVLQRNEMFGEEDIMNKKAIRSYSAVCSSLNGECIVIKKRDFDMRIMHEEGTKNYLERRLQKKNEHQENKLLKISSSIADFSNYVFYQKSQIMEQKQISEAISKIDFCNDLHKQITSNSIELQSFGIEGELSLEDEEFSLSSKKKINQVIRNPAFNNSTTQNSKNKWITCQTENQDDKEQEMNLVQDKFEKVPINKSSSYAALGPVSLFKPSQQKEFVKSFKKIVQSSVKRDAQLLTSNEITKNLSDSRQDIIQNQTNEKKIFDYLENCKYSEQNSSQQNINNLINTSFLLKNQSEAMTELKPECSSFQPFVRVTQCNKIENENEQQESQKETSDFLNLTNKGVLNKEISQLISSSPQQKQKFLTFKQNFNQKFCDSLHIQEDQQVIKSRVRLLKQHQSQHELQDNQQNPHGMEELKEQISQKYFFKDLNKFEAKEIFKDRNANNIYPSNEHNSVEVNEKQEIYDSSRRQQVKDKLKEKLLKNKSLKSRLKILKIGSFNNPIKVPIFLKSFLPLSPYNLTLQTSAVNLEKSISKNIPVSRQINSSFSPMRCKKSEHALTYKFEQFKKSNNSKRIKSEQNNKFQEILSIQSKGSVEIEKIVGDRESVSPIPKSEQIPNFQEEINQKKSSIHSLCNRDNLGINQARQIFTSNFQKKSQSVQFHSYSQQSPIEAQNSSQYFPVFKQNELGFSQLISSKQKFYSSMYSSSELIMKSLKDSLNSKADQFYFWKDINQNSQSKTHHQNNLSLNLKVCSPFQEQVANSECKLDSINQINLLTQKKQQTPKEFRNFIFHKK